MSDIQKISIEDPHYPPQLKKLKDAPKILYYKGILPQKEEILFAIVGTRKPSLYGKEVTFKIARELCEAGVVIVSGFAPGIDTIAHKAVIEKKKRTIAVLGTGLDRNSLYPKENLNLYEKILEYGGCLISEFPEGTPGSNFSFPRRNRLISGLSLGVLVVEAKESSGSLITAKFALKQNKKLFAIPGSIFSSNSKGPHKLIKEGAKLVESAIEILEKLSLRNLPSVGKEKPLSTNEKLILEALSEGPLSIDKIIEKTSLNSSIVISTLAILEISGKIRALGESTYGII